MYVSDSKDLTKALSGSSFSLEHKAIFRWWTHKTSYCHVI